MSIRKVGGGSNEPIRGRVESPKSKEASVAQSALKNTSKAGADFTAKIGDHPKTAAIARAIFETNS